MQEMACTSFKFFLKEDPQIPRQWVPPNVMNNSATKTYNNNVRTTYATPCVKKKKNIKNWTVVELQKNSVSFFLSLDDIVSEKLNNICWKILNSYIAKVFKLLLYNSILKRRVQEGFK